MKEYKMIEITGMNKADKAEKIMNELAADGWRVVSTTVNSGTARMFITFERDKN